MASRAAVTIRPPLALPGQRVGVMGGSFNPPHDGHLIVARTAVRRLQLDQLWWLVTPGNPLKAHDGLAPLEQRMEACRTLAGTDPRMKVTSFEAQLGSAYTALTLEYLKRRFPDVRFVWVMGADNLANFHCWQNWRGIAGMMPIAVVDRPGWRLRALASPAAQALRNSQIPETGAASLATIPTPCWTFLTSKLSSLSSTELRRRGA
ncbi:MAG: nicotinate-nucleotide adenylyltransferase [Hyphomicrobiaceae bacterium]|nr:nicotinate-nucleotide adenylyltransferase [Hyphomicrobiaceae bacterium]